MMLLNLAIAFGLLGYAAWIRTMRRLEDPAPPKRRRPPRRRVASPHLARMNALTQIAEQKQRKTR